jgi:hypothetical protein
MAQDIPIRCDECRYIIGTLTTTVHGNYQMSKSGDDWKCKHPPIGKCESAHKARSKAYASIRPVGREASDDMQ